MTQTVEPDTKARPAQAASLAPASLRHLTGRYDGPRDIGGQMQLANALATAKRTVPDVYWDNPGDVLSVIYHAMALDIGVTVAVQNLHFNRGKSGMSAQLMNGLLIRAGHTITLVELTASICRLDFTRGDGQPGGQVKWAIVEAQRAGLMKKDVWNWYPEDLLYARCLSRAARRYAADVVMGFGYTTEEIYSITPEEPETQDLDGLTIPVDPRVAELLEPLYAPAEEGGDRQLTAGRDKIREVWKKANRAELLDKFAAMVDGVAYDVGTLLAHLSAQAQEQEEADRAEADAAHAAAEGSQDQAEPQTQEPVPDPGQAPAGEGVLACGCPTNIVFDTGDHYEGCHERVA